MPELDIDTELDVSGQVLITWHGHTVNRRDLMVETLRVATEPSAGSQFVPWEPVERRGWRRWLAS